MLPCVVLQVLLCEDGKNKLGSLADKVVLGRNLRRSRRRHNMLDRGRPWWDSVLKNRVYDENVALYRVTQHLV